MNQNSPPRTYSLKEYAAYIRGDYLQGKLGMSLQESLMMDDQAVFFKLITDKPQDAQTHLRRLDSYGPDFKKALKQVDFISPIRTAGMALHDAATPETISLDKLSELQNKSGIEGFDVFPIEKPSPSGESFKIYSHGLFQVNDYYQGEENQNLVWGKYIDPSLMTPEENIEYSAKLKNKEGWKRWTTHRENMYQPYLGMTDDEISDTYKIDKKYLKAIDTHFKEDADTAKAIMIAESSGNINSMETITLANPNALPFKSEKSSNDYGIKDLVKDALLPISILTNADKNAPMYREETLTELQNGKKITKSLSKLLEIDIKPSSTSSELDSMATNLTENEDILKERGTSYTDNFLWNDAKIKDDLNISLGIPLDSSKSTRDLFNTKSATQDATSPKNVRVQMTPTQRLAAIRNNGQELGLIKQMLFKGIQATGIADEANYEGLKAANKLVRMHMEKEIQEDPELLAYSLFEQDKHNEDKGFFKSILSTDGRQWRYNRDVMLKSMPSIVATVAQVINTVTFRDPTVYALGTSYMFALQAGGSFDEVFGDLMENEVKEGSLSEEEALGAASSTWLTVGVINTALETMRVPQIAKAYNASIPKGKMYKKVFDRFKKGKLNQFHKLNYAHPLLEIPKQGIIEAVEEVFQGINERYQTATNLGTVRPDQDYSQVLNQSNISQDALGGFMGGMVFGTGGAALRGLAINQKRRAENDEINFDIDQEMDKENGQNLLAGQTKGLEYSRIDMSESYVENMTFESYLKDIANGKAPKFKDFKKIQTNNKVSSLIKQQALSGENVELGQQVLNIIAKNGNGIEILEDLGDEEKQIVTSIAKSYLRKQIDSFPNEKNMSDAMEEKMDRMILLIGTGEIKWEKGKLITTDVEGKKTRSRGKIVVKKGGKGESLINDLIIQRVEEEQASLSLKHEGNEERVEIELKNIQKKLESQINIESNKKLDKSIDKSIDKKLNKSIDKAIDKAINKGSHTQQKAYNEYAADLGNEVKNRENWKPKNNTNPLRAKAIKKIKAMEDSVKEISSLSATNLNKTLSLFPDYVKNNPKIKKTKNGKISFTAKNKKVIAEVILSSISSPKSETETTSSSKINIGTKSNKDISNIPKASSLSSKDLKEMVGISSDDIGLTKEDVGLTKEDIKEVKKKSSRRNMFDDKMSSVSAENTPLMDKLRKKTGNNKVKENSLEKQFKGLSPLAKALSLIDTSDGISDLSEQIDFLLSNSDTEYQDPIKRKFMVDRLMQTIKRKYGSEENFKRKLEDYRQTYEESSDDERSPFRKAADEIFKGFQELLKTDINRFSMNPLPSSDFLKASKHFEAAWGHFKKGYESLNISEKDLFKRFYNGVMKRLRKLKSKFANIKILMAWFTKWAKSTMPEANLSQRSWFGTGQDITGFSNKIYKPMNNDFQKYTQEFLDFIDYTTAEGVGNKLDDTYDDKIEQQTRDNQGLVKNATSFKNLLEESSGAKLNTPDINDIRWSIFSRGNNAWKKDSNGEFIEEASFLTMKIEEFYEYLSSEFNVNVVDNVDSMRNMNIVNSHFLNIISSINRGDSIEFNLMNVSVDKNGKQVITSQSEKQMHTENNHSPITDETKSDFIIANFLQENPNMKKRVALLNKNSIYNVSTKRAYKKNPYIKDGDGEFDSSKLFVKEDSWYNLDSETLNQMNWELAVNFRRFSQVQGPAFIVASKGGKAQSIIIGISSPEDVDIGQSIDFTNAFFDIEFEEGNITETQAEDMKKDVNTARGDSIELAVATVARYRFFQATHGTNSLHEQLGYDLKTHMKRYSGEFYDGVPPLGTNDFNFIHFDFKNTYAISDITGKTFPLMNSKEDYIWDGSKPTSSSYMEQVSSVIGRYPELGKEDNLPGWIKQFDRIMSEDNKDYIQVKGLNNLAPEGISVYEYADKENKQPSENDKLIWKTVKLENGNVEIVTAEGVSVSSTFSDGEMKMGQGEFAQPNIVHTIKTNDIRVLQNANYFSKGASPAPFQWFDYIQDLIQINPSLVPVYEKMLSSVKNDQQKYFKNIQRMRDNPDLLAVWIKSLSTNMTITKSNLTKMVELLEPGSYGFLLHSHNSSALSPMIKNRFIVDGAFSGKINSRESTRESGYQTANFSHLVPDYHGILKPHQFGATPFDPSWNIVVKEYLKNKDKSDWYKLGQTLEGRATQVQEINKFLAKNPIDTSLERWAQMKRYPIQHFTNPHMLKIAYFLGHQYGDVVFIHESVLPKIEADFDGDSISSRKWNPEITKDLIELQWQKIGDDNYGYSEQYKIQSYETPLDAFAQPKSEYTPTTANIVKEVANNFETGSQVGMITNGRTLRSALNHKGLKIDFEGDFYNNVILEPRKIDEIVVMDYAPLKKGYVPTQGDSLIKIKGIPYLVTTSDRELTILQQASFQESKQGLLSMWWKTINGQQTSIGTVNNFSAFVKSRIFRVVDKNTNEELDGGNLEAQGLIKLLTSHYKTSDVRQGKNSNQQSMGVEEIISESKIVHSRISSSLVDQVEEIKAFKLPKRKFIGSPDLNNMQQYLQERRPEKKLKVIDVIFENVNEVTKKPEVTYMEDTVGMLWNHMVVNGLTEYKDFLQYTDNQQANARYEAMLEIVGSPDSPHKLDELIEEYDLSHDDIRAGKVLSRKMNKDFYMAIQVQDEQNRIIDEISINTSTIDYDTIMNALEQKWVPLFNTLSDGAKFVSTLEFLSGTSTSQDMVPATTMLNFKSLVSENIKETQMIRRYSIDFNKTTTAHTAKINQLEEYGLTIEQELTEEGMYGFIQAKRGMSGADFKTEGEYSNFFRMKKSIDASYQELVDFKETITGLQNKVDRIKEEIANKRGKGTLATTTQLERRRAVTKFLPTDLLDKRFMRLFSKTWLEKVKNVNSDTPLEGMEIKLSTWLDSDYKKLEKKGDCKIS